MECPVLQHVPLCEPVAAERKYEWGGGGGAGARGCKADDYLCEASACEGQELGGLSPPTPPPPLPPVPPSLV